MLGASCSRAEPSPARIPCQLVVGAELHRAQQPLHRLRRLAAQRVLHRERHQRLDRARVQLQRRGERARRVLAGGALSGTEERHPLGSPPPAPFGSGANYRRDVERAQRLAPLVREGHADSLIEASIRYVIAQPAVSTVLVGYSTMEHLEYAARSIEKGPLSPAALARVAEIQQSFVGEKR